MKILPIENDTVKINIEDGHQIKLNTQAIVIAKGLDGKSAYEVAVQNGFDGTEEEWLESLKADCGDCTGGEPEAPEPVRRLLVPTGATENANGEYQHFESDGTHELLTSFGVSGLTAELDPVDWMLPDSHEYRLVIQAPAGLDDLNPDVHDPSFVYMLIADGAVADLLVEGGNAILVILSYVAEPEPALAIQILGGAADTVYLPYVVGQTITLLYQPLQQRVSVIADTNPVLEVADWPDQFANQHLNMGLLFASFVPEAIVRINAYAETLAVEPDLIGALIGAIEGRLDTAEQGIDQIRAELDQKINVSDLVVHFRGVHHSLSALQAAIPTGIDGDYAHIDQGVGYQRQKAIWDGDDNSWMLVAGAVAQTTDEVIEGNLNRFFTELRVLDTTLSGLVIPNGVTGQPIRSITASDSVRFALGILQSQINLVAGYWRTIILSQQALDAGFSHSGSLRLGIVNGMLWLRGLINTSGQTSHSNILLFEFPSDIRFVTDIGYSINYTISGAPHILGGEPGENAISLRFFHSTTHNITSVYLSGKSIWNKPFAVAAMLGFGLRV